MPAACATRRRAAIALVAVRDRRMILASARRLFHPALTDAELDELYDTACTIALERCESDAEPAIRAFIRTTVFNKAKMALRGERRHPTGSLERALAGPNGDGEHEPVLQSLWGDPEPTEERLERGEQAGLAFEILALLPQRTRTVLWLRYGLGLDPEEVREELGLSARQYAREVERGMSDVAEHVTVIHDGGWCDDRRSLLLAFAAGITNSDQDRRARAHLSHCSGCRRMVVERRRAFATPGERSAA